MNIPTIYSSVNRHLDHFPLGINNATMNIDSFFLAIYFNFSWIYMPWSGIAGSEGNFTFD